MSATVRFIYMIKWLFGEQNLQSIEVLFAREEFNDDSSHSSRTPPAPRRMFSVLIRNRQ